MSKKSKIEWTDASWNPVIGCDKVSPGCKNCYAETLSERFRGVKEHPYEDGFDLKLMPHRLEDPLKWSSRMIFVNSMSDLFHPDVPIDYINEVAGTMWVGCHHIYQVLTKRPERMANVLDSVSQLLRDIRYARHIWWGVSVENKKHGLPRIDILRNIPLKTRFLSIEPLLEDLGTLNLEGIDWVIVGGESGRGCRPMEKGWVINIRDQCEEKGVPFFFKQWGGYPKKRYGRLLDEKEYNEMPRIYDKIREYRKALKIVNEGL